MKIQAENREQWLELRRKGIGGSDASSITGHHPWRNNQTLFDEKMGLVEPPDLSDNEAVQYGINAEEPLRELFKLDFPRYHVEHEEYVIYQHPEHDFITGTFDGILTNIETGEKGILEIKTTTIYQFADYDKWKHQIPDNYYIQVLHYLLVSGYSFAVVVAQLKSEWQDEIKKETKHYPIDRRDHELDIEYLKNAEVDFWQNHILKNDRPTKLNLPPV